MRKKVWLFALLAALGSASALPVLIDLLRNTKTSEYYSHIVLIPVVSLYALIRHNKEIFRGTASAHPWGIAVMAAGIGMGLAGRLHGLELDVMATLATLGALLFSAGVYLVLFGKNASRRAIFPFAFLVFAVPIPVLIVEKIIAILVVGSAYLTRLILMGFGVPLVQDGPVFHLPAISIEVAPQCSGIRSSLALFITTVLAGHLFLRKSRSRVLLALAVLPVAMLKNAVRIVTLYLLSYFVDMRVIKGGFLHKSGGFIFFGLGLVVLGAVLWLLAEGERQKSLPQQPLDGFNIKKTKRIEGGG